MKNKFFILQIVFLFKILLASSLADEFKLNSKSLEVLNKGDIVKAFGEVEIITDNNLIIKSDNSVINKKYKYLEASGNVSLVDQLNEIEIKSNFIEYKKQKDLIYIKGPSEMIIGKNYKVKTKNLYFNREAMNVYSNFSTTITDKNENKIKVKSFNLDLLSKIAQVNLIELKDNQKNIIEIDEGLINLKDKEIIGKNVKAFLNKSIFNNKKNDPRIYGKSLISDNNQTSIYKGVFTSCQFRENNKCPPWTIKAKEVKHDKVKKTIEYKNAWLSIYDQPVVYFPYFYHPDPTVKRQSGFLMPKISNSSFLGSSLQIPYYNVISENKDFTISPRIFFNDKILLQSEYRQKNKFSDVILDHSLTKSNDSTISHLFGNYDGNFDQNNIEINLELTSNSNYLKKYEIQSELIENYSTLNSFISLENSKNDKYFYSSLEVFEDLTKHSSDSYEFVYPNYEFVKNFDTSSYGDLSFSTSGHQKKYDTNRYDGVVLNKLNYKSNPMVLTNGFVNDYSFVLKNLNSKGENSLNYKNTSDHKLLSKIMLNTKYPLIKKNSKGTKYLIPTISTRFSPSETKNIRSEDNRVDYLELFNLERLNDDDMIEGGESVTLGGEYKVINQSGTEIVNFSAGQVFRINENSDLPLNSSIGQKRSDIIGTLKLSPNDFLNIKYSFSYDNDLNNSTFNYTETDLTFSKFSTSFKYYEASDAVYQKSYISNTSKLNLNDGNSIQFATNKNLDTNLTEYYDLIYEYKNDCLTASIEYKKKYYNDVDLSPDENIFFTIKLLPFGEISSPNIN